jgi:DNA-binding MarR family transcriptional regulator
MTAQREASERSAAPAPHLRLRLWVRLLRAVRPIESELRRRLDREFGITLPKFDVMAALVRSPGGMTMTDVSRQLMVSNGNVTGIVDRLVAEELVARVADTEDRRAIFVRLTPKGRKLFESMAAAHEGWVDEILAGFSDARAESMVGLLDALRAETRTGGRGA